MAHVPKSEFTGKLIVDASAQEALIFDLPPKATRSLKREQEGIDEVLGELPGALAQHAKTLGLAEDTFQQIETKTQNIKSLREKRAESEKLTEVLGESVAYHEDSREADFSSLAEAVKRVAARKDPGIEAAFEKLLKYVGQVGVKAAATRRKNEAEAERNAGHDAPAGDGTNKPG